MCVNGKNDKIHYVRLIIHIIYNNNNEIQYYIGWVGSKMCKSRLDDGTNRQQPKVGAQAGGRAGTWDERKVPPHPS